MKEIDSNEIFGTYFSHFTSNGTELIRNYTVVRTYHKLSENSKRIPAYLNHSNKDFTFLMPGERILSLYFSSTKSETWETKLRLIDAHKQ